MKCERKPTHTHTNLFLGGSVITLLQTFKKHLLKIQH
jgi:hypothetical protein